MSIPAKKWFDDFASNKMDDHSHISLEQLAEEYELIAESTNHINENINELKKHIFQIEVYDTKKSLETIEKLKDDILILSNNQDKTLDKMDKIHIKLYESQKIKYPKKIRDLINNLPDEATLMEMYGED